MKNTNKLAFLTMMGISILLSVGCMRPVEPKTLVQAANNETMFVIPLVGENKDNQAQLNSKAYFDSKKVAVKELQLPYRWLQTGRFDFQGSWVPAAQVIKVDRTPVTVEFTVDPANPTKKDNNAIWTESSDSVGFSTGFSVSALVNEEDTSTFLYRYPAGNLKEVLLSEVRARIQQDVSAFCAIYPLDTLRGKKNEMSKAIHDDVVPFYQGRGITVTTIGQFGGMTYENPDIQKAIDNVFVAQTAKETAAALVAAQKDTNSRSDQVAQQERANSITLATGTSEAVRLKAQVEAAGVLLKAQADAKGIQAVAEATKEAASNPLFLEVRKLDVQSQMYARWNGTVPNTIMGTGGSGVNVFLPHTVEDAAAGTGFTVTSK